jgi:hypothetical protein
MPRKSKWTIGASEERDVFVNTKTQNWIQLSEGWGLHIVEGRVAYLGIAQDRARQLFVAKFVNSSQNQSWHGYPADHQRHVKDIPSEFVLRKWLDGGLLSPQKIAKLERAKPCSL